MGSTLSFLSPRTPAPEPQTADSGGPYFILPLPPEADVTKNYYDEFWERAYCAHHQDGESIIICWPIDDNVWPERDDEPEDGWAIKRLQTNYKLLRSNHSRVVRYVGSLSDGSVVVEKPAIGPLSRLNFPKMGLSVPYEKRDKTLLCLYYRWALQALSALDFFHSHKIYLRTFSERMIWLRADYSLAVTGFISAVKDRGLVDIEEDGEKLQVPRWNVPDPAEGLKWGSLSYHQPEDSLEFDQDQDISGNPRPCVKADLFQWAVFTWRLMTNKSNTEPETSQGESRQDFPLEKGGLTRNCVEGPYSMAFGRDDPSLFQNLEEARLGKILAKVWSGQYESAGEVVEQIKISASKSGITVVGDEVEIEGGWENVFELVDKDSWAREAIFKKEY